MRAVGFEPTSDTEFKSAAYTIPPRSHVWSSRLDSNQDRSGYEPPALPLCYARFCLGVIWEVVPEAGFETASPAFQAGALTI